MTPKLLRCGQHAVLVEVDSLDQVLALAEAVRAAAGAGAPGFTEVVDVVPAAATVLVQLDEDGDLNALRRGLAHLETPTGGPVERSDAALVEIAVHYDGPDLGAVAELTGLTPEEVIAAHTGQPWSVAFGGFAPGFAYLTGGDQRLRVPRRPEPRTSVPAGAVALAGEFSAVYPRSSPGGWQLLGHTDAIVWDLDRDPPALLQPGVRVQFTQAGA